MKKLLLFIIGLLVGFLGTETLSHPRPTPVHEPKSAPANRPPDAGANVGVAETTDASAITAVEASPTKGANILPAALIPGQFVLLQQQGIQYEALLFMELGQRPPGTDGAALRADAAFMAKFRENVRQLIDRDLQAERFLLRLDQGRFNQVVGLVTDQVIERIFWSRTNDRTVIDARRLRYSDETAAKLATVLTPDELEKWAGIGPYNAAAIFRQSVEAFAIHGLPIPTSDQIDALLGAGVVSMPDGRTYRTLRFDPAAAPESMSSQQRAYLDQARRWGNARLIVDTLNRTRVRDPEVWEIWPD